MDMYMSDLYKSLCDCNLRGKNSPMFDADTLKKTASRLVKRYGLAKEDPSAEEDLYAELHPGRGPLRTENLDGRPHPSHRRKRSTYTVDVLDAKRFTEIEVPCRVFLVPPQRAEEWLFTSIHGQWQVVTDSKAGRLILITKEGSDHNNDISQMKDDVSELVTPFLPLDCRSSGEIEYLTQENNIKVRRQLALVESPTTGPMLVEDVAIPEIPAKKTIPAKKAKSKKPARKEFKCYRRLSFRRNPNMIQSEALLTRDGVAERSNGKVSSEAAVFDGLKVDHNVLTNEYHEGMIAAFVLIANNLEKWLASEEMIRVMIIGLGAGLLPMFVHNYIPVKDIQVVELDEAVGEIAKDHFGFIENEKMKLQIGDGVIAIRNLALLNLEYRRAPHCSTDSRLHVLIVDTDSSDPSNGLSCPAPECLEDLFLFGAREVLHDGGMLVVNVVASSKHYHLHAKAQLKRYFPEVYEIEVDKDVNRVLIALAQPRRCNELGTTMKDLAKLKRICNKFPPRCGGPDLQQYARGLKRVE